MAHKLASAAWFKSQVYHLGLPGGTSGKELACHCRRHETGSIPGREDPLEKGMATHSSILCL